MILETLWSLFLAAVCFWIAGQESTICGILAAILALLITTVCVLTIAVYFASLSVVRKAVSDAGVGRTIFDAIFDYALGISGEDTGERTATARVPTHMSRDEVKKTLHNASKNSCPTNHPQPSGLARFFGSQSRFNEYPFGQQSK